MAWIDTQVARGHSSSAEDYLVQLVEKERARQEWLKQVRRALADARAGGVAVRAPAAIVAALGQPARPARDPARLAALRAEIALARAAGPSGVGAADVLARVLQRQRPASAGVPA